MLKFSPRRITAERSVLNLSQAELGERIGKNRQWVAKRENAEVKTGAEDLALIATGIGIKDINFFFTYVLPK